MMFFMMALRQRFFSRYLPSFATLCLLFGATGISEASNFVIDPAHSAVYFAASHFERSLVRGRFNKISALLDYDETEKHGKIEIVIDPDSTDTGIKALDRVLQSEQFFNSKTFPTIRFHAERFTLQESSEATAPQTVTGELTLHGVSHPLSLQVKRFSCGTETLFVIKRHVCGGDFTATLLRSDYGMSQYASMVSDRVDIDITVVASPAP